MVAVVNVVQSAVPVAIDHGTAFNKLFIVIGEIGVDGEEEVLRYVNGHFM